MRPRHINLLLTPIYVFSILIALTTGLDIGLAQGRGPIVDILGRPTTTPPDVHTYVSVIDPSTGRAIDGLSDTNFAVQVSGEDTDATVELETRGIAVVMIIDRGGIAQRGDPRIGQAVDMVDQLLSKLDLNGGTTTDMAALIGIRGREEGGLTPTVRFTDFDPNAIRNEFDKLRTEVVNEVTPLYDGIDQAIEWITENDQANTQEKLTHRRPILIVFSDGIDNQFSSESHETIIINKCLQNNIMLYAVRMEAPGRTTDADNLEALASQTNGLYITHNADTHDQVLSLFDDIVTQRQSYRVTFPLYRPQGDYQVRIRVLDTPVGDGSAETTASSKLQVPKIGLTSPADGLRLTVPYSKTLSSFETTLVTLTSQITPADGAVREPTEVRYFANGVRIGASTASPNYQFVWNVSNLVTPTIEMQAQSFTLIAEADDPYLDAKMTAPPVNIAVTWEKKQVPIAEATIEEAKENWWMIIALVAMLIGLLILLILLIRTRGDIARKAVKSTTGVLKGVTKRLGATPQRAPGKLVIVQGANIGKEHRLSAQVTKVGRDPQFCDLALYDEFVSNPHFSIRLDQTQFYITDEGSTNGTKLNGMPIPSHQRILLQPDALIELGSTRLQFKRLGGTTRQLSRTADSTPPPTPPSPPSDRPSNLVQGPSQSKRGQRGDSTRQV